MRSRAELIRNIIAALLFAAFAACGLRGLESGRSRRVDGNGPLNSMDGLLAEALQTNEPGKRITAALADLPPDAPVAILCPVDDTYGKLLLPEIGAITWAHPVYLIQTSDAGVRDSLLKLRDRHFAAALIYHLSPPVLPSNVQLIGMLTVVPIAQ